jgi:hypothetical protein
MATLYYKGLTGIKDDVTIADLTTATLGDLIIAIAADEGLPTDYYNISVLGNPAINSISLDDSSNTCAAAGIVDGDTILCTPEQSGSKERRQIQKLEIAQLKRRGTPGDDSSVTVGYYRPGNTYDRDKLPTKYSGNTVVDNPNPGGLKKGRPWS